ncbi:cytochrome P450 [Mycena olivaceomarginata]|nr:cytochrome P450 [Mycena olivaceomarginata]
METGLISLSVVGLATGILFLWLRATTNSNLPPGPPRAFLRDNRADVPLFHFWKTFRLWNIQYGPVIAFYLGRKPVIVLGTAEAAHDLLETKGDVFSDTVWGMRGMGMSYGPRYRQWKSLIQAGLSNAAALKYRQLQSIEASILIRDLLNSQQPLAYKDPIRRFVVSIIFCVAYGRRIKSLSDDVVFSEWAISFSNLSLTFYSVPGKFLVESWPALLYCRFRFLQWFRWEPERHRTMDTKLYLSIMNDVKRQIAENTAQPSMAAHSLSRQAEFGLNDVETAYALSAPWAAGVGTVYHFTSPGMSLICAQTVASIEVFLLAMILYPETMKRGQEEIDSVVGHGRLPVFQDYDSLPFIQALIKEVTRWRCIAPTGFPHAAMADARYQGMFIPSGATVYANIYAMTTDPDVFPDPDEFKPERFLDASQLHRGNFDIPFGFGRRFCPGQHVALQTIFISVVRILWAFDVLPGLNDKGDVVLPSADAFTSGLITRPMPFPCRFKPRHAGVEEVVINEAERADVDSAAWP